MSTPPRIAPCSSCINSIVRKPWTSWSVHRASDFSSWPRHRRDLRLFRGFPATGNGQDTAGRRDLSSASLGSTRYRRSVIQLCSDASAALACSTATRRLSAGARRHLGEVRYGRDCWFRAARSHQSQTKWSPCVSDFSTWPLGVRDHSGGRQGGARFVLNHQRQKPTLRLFPQRCLRAVPGLEDPPSDGPAPVPRDGKPSGPADQAPSEMMGPCHFRVTISATAPDPRHPLSARSKLPQRSPANGIREDTTCASPLSANRISAKPRWRHS